MYLVWVYVCSLQNVGSKVDGSVYIEEKSLKASLELVIDLRNASFLNSKRLLIELNQVNSFVSNLQNQTVSSTGSVPPASIKQI
jgi:hypothetical protein